MRFAPLPVIVLASVIALGSCSVPSETPSPGNNGASVAHDGIAVEPDPTTAEPSTDRASAGPKSGSPTAPTGLAGTSWTVTAVNGRATGGGPNYYLNFTADRLSARFGCNSIGGPYQLNGDHLSAGSLEQTLMGCPQPAAQFEEQGSAILRSNTRIERTSEERARLVSEMGTIDLARGT